MKHDVLALPHESDDVLPEKVAASTRLTRLAPHHQGCRAAGLECSTLAIQIAKGLEEFPISCFLLPWTQPRRLTNDNAAIWQRSIMHSTSNHMYSSEVSGRRGLQYCRLHIHIQATHARDVCASRPRAVACQNFSFAIQAHAGEPELAIAHRSWALLELEQGPFRGLGLGRRASGTSGPSGLKA